MCWVRGMIWAGGPSRAGRPSGISWVAVLTSAYLVFDYAGFCVIQHVRETPIYGGNEDSESSSKGRSIGILRMAASRSRRRWWAILNTSISFLNKVSGGSSRTSDGQTIERSMMPSVHDVVVYTTVSLKFVKNGRLQTMDRRSERMGGEGSDFFVPFRLLDRSYGVSWSERVRLHFGVDSCILAVMTVHSIPVGLGAKGEGACECVNLF
jgi:hypothetical protein